MTVNEDRPATTFGIIEANVYQPQDDSYLLCEALRSSGVAAGARVADLCTGSGVIAHAAARAGARSVVAVDTSPIAVQVARLMCRTAPTPVSVELGDFAALAGRGGFDVVTCNPPYVPTPESSYADVGGPRHAWDAGADGREVLDRLCGLVGDLLVPGGTCLLVQSEFADVQATLAALTATGLDADVYLARHVPFGPVLTARARWLESTGRLDRGRRVEELVVVRADKRRKSAGWRMCDESV
ncbi:HemK2/MTQ2 family protein methyltransferase [Gordonia sp. ABSL49_1]|uniref:HemK2/MTQ2 family protein methyltransferase n=1 Tax=Gordonia sp. ABSL49_1 TaxID=2920941 RepID=UPI001F0DB1E7|nr:HemK2/MTQ2 family protein methyltransferase [Gordonia sp. ABSL49_1]MCH5641224.1 methyltransferase [Gordonia sp. ABSL49_1]